MEELCTAASKILWVAAYPGKVYCRTRWSEKTFYRRPDARYVEQKMKMSTIYSLVAPSCATSGLGLDGVLTGSPEQPSCGTLRCLLEFTRP